MSSLLNPARYAMRPDPYGEYENILIQILNANRGEVLETTSFSKTQKLHLSKKSTYFCYCCINSLLLIYYRATFFASCWAH